MIVNISILQHTDENPGFVDMPQLAVEGYGGTWGPMPGPSHAAVHLLVPRRRWALFRDLSAEEFDFKPPHRLWI